jgi:purine-binding chemotaxis protein CheW
MNSGSDGACMHLIVQAGAYRCAVPLDRVQRVTPGLTVTPLPGAAHGVRGVATYLGEPLPVLDLAVLAEAPPGPHPEHPVVVIANAGPAEVPELVGLAADAALDIAVLPERDIAPSAGGLVRGEATLAGEPVRVIDLVAVGRERR